MSAAGTIGEIAGSRAGGILGGIIGELFGPEMVPVGVWAGSRLGAMAGKAAGEAIANAMTKANADAETKTKADAATEPCVNCGDIDCFNPPEGADPEEFKKQLQEQQDAINDVKPEDLIKNMDKYKANGRGAGDASGRQLTRDQWRARRTLELTDQYEATMDAAKAGAKAAADAAAEMKSLDATHALDLIADGDGSFSGLGDRSINRSLGSQWSKGRAAQLREHAEAAKEQGKKMNAKLEECPDGGKPGAKTPKGGSVPASPGSGTGPPPPTS